MFRIRKRIFAILAIVLSLGMFGTGIALAASGSVAVSTADYCVKFGSGASAAGNIVEFNWDNSPCPPGTYPHSLRVSDSDPFQPPNFYLNSAATSPNDRSGLAFRITDLSTAVPNVNPGTIYDCFFTVPKGDPLVPGIQCVRH